MNIVNWTPFRELEDIFGRYRRLAPGVASNDGDGEPDLQIDWRPAADISESKNEYMIKAELPEVERNDVHVSIDGGTVTISGERKMEKEEKDSTQHRIESFYGTFSRSFVLPDNVDADKISAESKNGVLKVHLPKTEETQPKAIEIAVK